MTVKTRRLILYFSSNSSRAFWVKASQLPVTADKRQGRREQEGKGPHADSAFADSALRAGLCPPVAVRKHL